MPLYFIEREIPGAGKLTAQELKDISAKSNEVVARLGVPYKWITSYVTDDKICCVHEAPNPDAILRHASRGGFPANKVTEIRAIIGPDTSK